MELSKVELSTDGRFADHNYPCPVCRKKHAVLNLSKGVFEPCWECQSKGFNLVNLTEIRPWWIPARAWGSFFGKKLDTAKRNDKFFNS